MLKFLQTVQICIILFTTIGKEQSRKSRLATLSEINEAENTEALRKKFEQN